MKHHMIYCNLYMTYANICMFPKDSEGESRQSARLCAGRLGHPAGFFLCRCKPMSEPGISDGLGAQSRQTPWGSSHHLHSLGLLDESEVSSHR